MTPTLTIHPAHAPPIAWPTVACFGVGCARHSTCAHYAEAELNAAHGLIATCNTLGTTNVYPLYLARSRVARREWISEPDDEGGVD